MVVWSMASLGHVAIGMAAARFADGRIGEPERAPPYRAMLLWSLVSLLPDVDAIGFALGVGYGDAWGHRGMRAGTWLEAERVEGFERDDEDVTQTGPGQAAPVPGSSGC